MRILITGGAGFIGGMLAKRLVERGEEVSLMDVVFPPGRLGSLEGKVKTREGNLAIFTDVLDAFRTFRPESVFHLGALLSASAEANPVSAYHVDVDGSFFVLEAARLFDVKKVVYTSSIASFGPGVPDPVPNECDQKPTTLYGVSKVFTERMGEYYRHAFGIGFRALRLPSILGAGRGGGGASAYTTFLIDKPAHGEPVQAWCEERSRIPLLYVDDAVSGLVKVHDTPDARLTRSSYNIQGFSPTARQMADAVKARIPGAQISFAPDPKMQAIVDSWPRALDDSEARKDWGWAPTIDLNGTIDRYLAAAKTSA
ncbi:MAG: NAD-dependent epimerase/dehydratase family protein [Candidatus Thermoplasmatota archaeon]|jgi:threonine 3-dehydrogenase|nr:NAD-dependent epimerase/dehydratase family protein [Candidatus Thermoplasmatota archaeon]MCL5984777.1 NAD-dependent epimerase/dehydratase family protein [Candidatus Thermoplasmatota archaeon]